MLSQKHLQDVCLVYNHDHTMCRYTAQDPADWQKTHCCKLRPESKRRVDVAIKKFFIDCKSKGVDPHNQNIAQGNNCKGYPIFKHLEQGYDKEKI